MEMWLERVERRFEIAATFLSPGHVTVTAVVASTVPLRLLAVGARAVGVARVGAPGVVSAVVPAGALVDLLGGLADVADGVVDLTLGAAQLVGLLAVEAGEEELAVGGVGEERVLVEQALAAHLGLAGAAEAVDDLGLGVLRAPLALLGELLGPDARAQLDVEDEGGDAGHLEGDALVAAVELAALGGVLVVEEAVGARAARVDALLRLLHEGALAAVDVVRQLAHLVVDLAVVEEEAVLAEQRLELAARADVVQVALLGVAELAVGLGAAEVELGAGELGVQVVLGRGGAHQQDQD